MKTSAEKSSTTVSPTRAHTSSTSFFSKAGGGDFFAPVASAAMPSIQTKLEVNRPGDRFEREADTMADKVVRMPSPPVATPPVAAPPMKERETKVRRQPEEKKLQRQPEEKKLQRQPEEKKLQRQPEEKKLQRQPEEKKLQRKESGVPSVSAPVQSSIQSRASGGQPLPSDVRSYMEPRFNADFSNVRVHNDAQSASLSNQLSARAFTYQNHVFFSRNQFQPGTSEGKHLLAHELTHTIQQGHAVQRTPQVSTTTTPPPVQRLGISDALDYFADKAYHVPGFRMLTIVLGFNPINMASTDRSAANILRALIEMVPGGHLITQALDNHGVFTKAGAWVEEQLASLGDIGSAITSGLDRFIDSLSWDDIFDLGGVWERAKSIFTGPIGDLIAFAAGVVTGLMDLVREAVLRPLAEMAEGTRGYPLLKAVLGRDPITGDPVPQDAEAVIGGFMTLIGQDEVWQNIKKGNAVARAWAWFQGALSGLMAIVEAIPGQIMDTLASITWEDVITIVGVFTKVGKAFLNIATQFGSWALEQVIGLLEILFSVVAPNAVPYIKKAQGAFESIIRDPIGFVGNLVRAGKLGFQRFAANIVTHLKTALIKWITGPLGEAGVYIPKSFDLMEIIRLVLSVLGLTWQNIRSKLVKVIPEPVLVVLEKTAGILVTLVKDGPAAAWEQIKAELNEMKGALIAQVTQMISVEVVKAAVIKLVSMLNPAGAVIQAIIAIYNTITFFIEKASQIGAVVGAFINSIAAIASGQVDAAAAKVEQTMANALTVIIAFLAKFAGLGNIPTKVVGIVKKIRAPIDKGLDKIVAWLGKVLQSAKEKIISFFFKPKTFAVKGASHRLYAEGGGVMLASVPARLGAALGRFRAGPPPAKKPVTDWIDAAESKGTTLQKNIDKKDPSLEKANEQLSSEIVGLLTKILYETGGAKVATMPLATVTFNVSGDPVEFKRQIAMQQSSLTGMKVADWQKNRARFVAFGRESRSVDSDKTRVAALAKLIIANPKGVTDITAAQRATLLTFADASGKITSAAGQAYAHTVAEDRIGSRSARGQAVLHTVDQVAGGSATTYGDQSGVLGSSSVNSAIGSQWKDRIASVDAKAVDVEPTANVNVKLIA
jgi:hypothetical protein